LLQHGADPTIRNSENKTPIDLANVSGVLGINEVLTGEWRKDEVQILKNSLKHSYLYYYT